MMNNKSWQFATVQRAFFQIFRFHQTHSSSGHCRKSGTISLPIYTSHGNANL